MASAADYVKLASTLPPMLHRFFARFPPGSNAANIFRHTKNEITGRWHNPKYSLRRQKELVKLSQDYGVEELLPPTVKSSVARAERAALGPRLRRMMTPKGKGWERSLRSKYVYSRPRWVRRVGMSANGVRRGAGRLEVRTKAMEGMPALIEKWRKLGHGRGWKDWPK